MRELRHAEGNTTLRGAGREAWSAPYPQSALVSAIEVSRSLRRQNPSVVLLCWVCSAADASLSFVYGG